MKPMKFRLKGLPINQLLTAFSACVALATTSASAITDTWIGTGGAGGSGNWDSTSPNWNDGTTAGVVFANGNDVVFSNNAGGTITVVGTVSPASTLFSATTGNHVLAAGGIISGAGPLIKSGTGELQIRNTNSFTGKTTINAGTVRILGTVGLTNAGVNGPLGAPVGADATIDLFNGATLVAGNTEPRINQGTNRPLNLAGSGVGTVSLRVNDNDTRFTFGNVTASGTGAKTLALFTGNFGNGDRESVIFNGGISNASDGSPTSLTVSFNTGNSAHVSLVGANTFTGSISTVNVNAGQSSVSTLTVGGLFTGPNAANGLATEDVRGTGNLGGGNYPGAISLGSKTVLNYRSTNNQTLAGVISGTGAVTVDGLSTVTLTNSNTYTGNTTVGTGSSLVLSSGAGMTMAVTNTSATKITGAGSATLNGTFTFDLGAVTNATGSWTLVDTASKSFGATFSVAGFTQASDVWTLVSGPKTWTFTEGTGVLSLTSTALFSSFGISGFAGVIDNEALTIRLVVPRETNLATLAPIFTVTSGTVNQTSGAPPSPTFAASNPVTYTITDGPAVRSYLVTAVLASGIINFRVSNGTNIPEDELEGPAGPPVPGTQTWNQVDGLPGGVASLSATNLRDSSGVSTTVGLTTNNLNGSDDWGLNAPLRLLSRSARVFSNSPGNGGSFTITNLTPESYYDLWIASAHVNGSGIGTWSTTNTHSTGNSIPVDNTGQAGNGSTWVFGVNYVRFQNVQVSVSGNITMSVTNAVGSLDSRVGFNGFQLIPVQAPASADYNAWIGTFPSITAPGDKLSTADPDKDGLSNQEEYAFGLNPSSGSSVNPITMPLDKATGTFSYTRRATLEAPGLDYTVLTSTDLVTWKPDTGSAETIVTVGDVETVTFTVTNPAVDGKLFVRVEAL
jgi:fibronectin-binding autotransporter adhesin